MLESFHLGRSGALIESSWKEKISTAEKLMGQAPQRELRPELLGDRMRLDLQWNGENLGVFTAGRTFVPVEFPDTITPELARALEDFRALGCPLPKASLRFRAGLGELKGLWIDTANVEVKKLLDEGDWLSGLLERHWIVEVGQKRKAVYPVQGGGRMLRLDEAPALPWFPSFSNENAELPLLSHVSLFSQPGREVNRALIVAGLELLEEASHGKKMSWAEWGSGCGNLTAPFAMALGTEGWASESDPVAADCLSINAKEFFPGIATSPAFADGKPESLAAAGAREIWIVDPPRSGFPQLLGALRHAKPKPLWVLAYHCHEDGLKADTMALQDAGYKLHAWSGIDAFPATPHLEVASIWRLP